MPSFICSSISQESYGLQVHLLSFSTNNEEINLTEQPRNHGLNKEQNNMMDLITWWIGQLSASCPIPLKMEILVQKWLEFLDSEYNMFTKLLN